MRSISLLQRVMLIFWPALYASNCFQRFIAHDLLRFVGTFTNWCIDNIWISQYKLALYCAWVGARGEWQCWLEEVSWVNHFIIFMGKLRVVVLSRIFTLSLISKNQRELQSRGIIGDPASLDRTNSDYLHTIWITGITTKPSWNISTVYAANDSSRDGRDKAM